MRYKPRKDAPLKMLPPVKRKALWDFLQEHGQEEAIAFVKTEFGIKTSEPALTYFWQWYPLASQLEEAASLTNQLKTELLNLPGLNLSDDQLSEAGQVMFEMIAIKQQDSALYQGLRRLRQADREQRLSERKITLLEEKAKQAEKAAGVTDDSKLSDAEKVKRLKQIFGAS